MRYWIIGIFASLAILLFVVSAKKEEKPVDAQQTTIDSDNDDYGGPLKRLHDRRKQRRKQR